MEFSLEKFEAFAYGRDIEMATRELVALLSHLDAHYGGLGQQFKAQPLGSVTQEDVHTHVWTRAAAAASCLLADKTLFFSPEWQLKILTLHRWLSALFAATPFHNTDHIMRALNRNDESDNLQNVSVAPEDMLKFCFLYSADSEVPLNLDALWEHNPVLAASLAMLLLSPRFLGSPAAHGKREAILPWLSQRLPQIADLEMLPTGVMHDVYMHCSYADRADKHQVKAAINTLIRRKLSAHALLDGDFSTEVWQTEEGSKPVLLVILEWFSKAHSIYRTHSRTIEAISVIDGIAFQTNILALNAAVEAARAGEQGRGFAVVASEVRTLAQRSAAAAKEIKGLIDTSVERVDNGSRLVEQAGHTMEEVVASVKRVTDVVAEITAASGEQSDGIEQINQAIVQMDEVTQQNAALVEEAAAAAQSLQEQSGRLVETVSIFKLSSHDQQRAAAPAAAPRTQRTVDVTPRAAALPRKPAARPSSAASAPASRPTMQAAAAVDGDWEQF